MPSNYPDSADSFNEPTIPEETNLSSAGTGSRNHTEHHRDLGDAVEAIQANAAQLTHDHAGGDGDFATPKLSQANTHQDADTDASPTSIHHTLGTTANKAAAGDHHHNWNASPPTIDNRPLVICTSTTRPSSPYLGLMIFETNTNRFRIWAQFPGNGSPLWQILPMGATPIVRLRQSLKQPLAAGGTTIQWQEELEDPFDYFNPAVPTNIVMKEAGLYLIEAAVQWDPEFVPDIAFAIACLDTTETTLKNQQFMRGNLFTPGFSQTLQLVGKLRVTSNQVLTIKTKYTAGGGILGQILSYFDNPSKINSRLDITFIAP